MVGVAQVRTLQELIDSVPNIVDYLYNQQLVFLTTFPNIPSEFTNWRDEQHAWREAVALFDQSYHMTNLFIYGPDAFRMLNYLGINTFRGFEPGQAKHFIACSPEGYIIGDGILFYLDKELFKLVSRPGINNWVRYHVSTGNYDVRIDQDAWSVADPHRPRRVYRFQLQGPNAIPLLEKLNGGPLPEVKFFHMGWITVAGRKVRFLRHGMAGVPGAELFGPWEDREEVKAAIVQAGQDFGLHQVGSKAYITSGIDGVGWIPSPVPAIYTSPTLRPYRQWLPATTEEATGSLGGSFYSTNIEDYYFTPWELGYGHILKFDHEFVGRESLERMVKTQHRKKVTLVWHGDDVTHVFHTLFTKPKGARAKYMDLPVPRFALWQYDKVLNKQGDLIGISTTCGYSSNEGAMLSLAVVQEEYSQIGTEVVLVWGEPGGGSRKPSVERHIQMEIRATVGPVPYAEPARQYLAAARQQVR